MASFFSVRWQNVSLEFFIFFIVGEVMTAYYLTSDLARQKPGVRMGIAATLIGWPMVGRHLRDVIRSLVLPKPEPNPREPSNVFACSGGLPLLDLMFYRLNRFEFPSSLHGVVPQRSRSRSRLKSVLPCRRAHLVISAIGLVIFIFI